MKVKYLSQNEIKSYKESKAFVLCVFLHVRFLYIDRSCKLSTNLALKLQYTHMNLKETLKVKSLVKYLDIKIVW